MIRWIVSGLLAAAMQGAVYFILPLDASRIVVIVAGGLAALIWSRLDDLITGKLS